MYLLFYGGKSLTDFLANSIFFFDKGESFKISISHLNLSGTWVFTQESTVFAVSPSN